MSDSLRAHIAFGPELPEESAPQVVWEEYRRLSQQVVGGERRIAEQGFAQLLPIVADTVLQARIRNDLGVLAAADGRMDEAHQMFAVAAALAPDWPVPRENQRRLPRETISSPHTPSPIPTSGRQTRVAIVSLLFNWPSTGGGAVHTAETGKFLTQAGYEVRHLFAQFADWGLGNVTEPLLAPGEGLRFTPEQWTVSEIQRRFREALQAFKPDWVIVTDSWNFKPLLAEAARDFRFFLRIAAQECLCPLNNVRLLLDQGQISNCPKHQLATPAACYQCVFHDGRFSGQLHQFERELAGYGTNEYDSSLRWAFANAEAVLVVNPLIAAMVSPYAKTVRTIPSGFDSARFPRPGPASPRARRARLQILFAGLVEELMKGFQVVHEACRRLWGERQDFELLATAEPPGQVDAFTRYIGWQSQSTLPTVPHDADMLVFPSVAEEALGRTAMEAMGVGRPVIASRIGGLQFTVVDGETGLLFEPGNVEDLCQKLRRLLDDSELRERLGNAGRERFEEHYTWDSILARHYLPLLGEPVRNVSVRPPP